MTESATTERASLEALVETGMLPLETLHPGGLETTRQLAALCGIAAGTAVLDVACGTGESACFLAREYGARVTGIDHADEMLRRAAAKARAQGLAVTFTRAEAAALPFGDGAFDVAICECTLCLLDKARALAEMARVVRPGGCVGMHDLCWQPAAPERLKHTLAHIEGEAPETCEGWRRLFAGVGLADIAERDLSEVKARWMASSRRRLGSAGQAALALKILRRWGVRGALRVLRAERAFSSARLGYVLIAGRKP